MSEKKLFSGAFRILGLTVAIVFGVALLLYSVLTGMSYSVSDQAAREWADRLGSLDEVVTRYPSRDCNAAAIALEPVVAQLGFDLAPRGTRIVPIDDATAATWKGIAGRLGKYIDKELSRSGGVARAPKQKVVAWLDDNRPQIDAVVDRLVSGDTPRWLLHLERLHSAPVPNLVGLVNLQRVLISDALYRAHLGDMATATERLEASWRLNEGISEDPVLVTRLISMAGLRMELGTLRRIDSPPATWRTRLAAMRPRKGLIEGLELEAWMWNHLDEPVNAMPVNNPQRAVLRVAAPYVRLCAADTSRRLRRSLEHFKRLEHLCDRDLDAEGASLRIDIPTWNRLGNMMAMQLGPVVMRAARLEVDIELTSRVLALRAEQGSLGARPASMPRFEASTACPDDRWDYSFDRDHGAGIALSRDLTWPKTPGVELPTRFKTGP